MNTDDVSLDGATVVVPCHQAAATIDAQLAALATQDFAGRLEVLVVDNASTDGTAARARAWAAKLPGLRVLEANERLSPAYARNVGIRAATYEVVLACDADDIVDRSWVRELVHALQTCDIVGGGVVDWFGARLPDHPKARPFGRAGFGFLPALSGCNVGVHKSAWSSLGGFDEDLLGCEDIDLAWRAQLAGLQMYTCVGAFVYHRVPARPVDVFRKWLLYGTYQPLLFAKFRGTLSRQPVHRALGRWLVLVLTCYRFVLGSADQQRAWCAEAGRRSGRVVGSIRFRSLYL
jgi:GT2 family glycosyltransferase